MSKELFHKLAKEVEESYNMGGLADGDDGDFYEGFFWDVCQKYIKTIDSEDNDCKGCNRQLFSPECGACGPYNNYQMKI